LILLFDKRTNAINENVQYLRLPNRQSTGAPSSAPLHHACAHEINSFAFIDFGHNITLVEFVKYDTGDGKGSRLKALAQLTVKMA
jgi:hypothetical protein